MFHWSKFVRSPALNCFWLFPLLTNPSGIRSVFAVWVFVSTSVAITFCWFIGFMFCRFTLNAACPWQLIINTSFAGLLVWQCDASTFWFSCTPT